MHPKTEIRADQASVQKILDLGWVGQLKVHGHRAQIHISADSEVEPIAYARAGHRHKLALSAPIIRELRRVFAPRDGWNVIDAEWLKPEGKIYVFDLIKREGELLSRMSFPERWKLLPRSFISPHLSVLPLIETLDDCMRALDKARDDEHLEGLVFKSRTTPGFEDTAIVRCRVK